MKIKSLVKDERKGLFIPFGTEFDVIAVEDEFFRIVDGTGEDYLYPQELFEVTDETGREDITYKRGKKVKVS